MRLRTSILGLALVALCSQAHAGETKLFSDTNVNGFKFYNPAAPTLGTSVLRLEDIVVGAGYLKAPGLNTLPVTASSTIPLSDVTGVYSSSRGLGPTALGSAGVATTLARSDIAAAAYRSDTLSTTWFVDPVNGSDLVTNACTTSATACATLGEIRRRWWGADIASNTTINILGNLSAGDTGTWHFTAKPGVLVTVLGNLGPTTGFGGAAIDNTLYTGTVTSFAGMANAPTADDIEITDTAIPTSYTASGLLASGVIFRRNSGGAVVHWFALKDLGGKTIRGTSPIGNVGQTNYQTLNISDGFGAYAMVQMPSQQWGAAAPSVVEDTLYHIGAAVEQGQYTARRRRVWLGTQATGRGMGFAGWVNCLFEVGATASIIPASVFAATPNMTGGGIKGTGSSVVSIFRDLVIGSCAMTQGVQLAPNDAVLLAIEGQWAQYDTTIACLSPTNAARVNITIASPAGAGMSGKGNSSKIFATTSTQDGSLNYGFAGAAPPFIAGVTSDGSPVQINGVNYTVAQLPTTANTTLDSSKPFPVYGYDAATLAHLAWDAVPANSYVRRNGSSQIVGVTTVPYTDVSGAPAAITATTGDVVAVGPGSVPATIQPDAVNYAKMQNVSAASRVICRGSAAGAGDPQECTLGSGISMSGTTISAIGSGGTVTAVTATLPLTSSLGTTPDIALQYDNSTITLNGGNGIQVAAQTGDVLKPAGSNTTTLANIPTATPMAGSLLATAIAAPSTPAAGKGSIYVDSTSKNLAVKDDAGTVKHGVQTKAAVASNFVTAISDAGVVSVAQPAWTDLTGAPVDISGAHYVTTQAEASLSAETNLGALAAGILGQTVSGGVSTPINVVASTGLTLASPNLTVDLSTGKAGGQPAIGGTGSGDNLTLSSTTNGTKGKVLLGSSANFFNEAAPTSTSQFTIGNSSTSPTGALAQFNRNANGPAYMIVSNPNAGGLAEAGLILSQSETTYTNYLYASQLSSGYATIGPFVANAGAFEHVTSGSAHMFFSAYGAQDIDFYTTTSRTLRLKVANNGVVTIPALGTGIVKGTSGALGLSTLGGGGHRIMAANSGGTDLESSDEVRLDSDNFWLSNDAGWVHQNTSAGGFQGVNYDRVRAFWSGDVWNLKSEKGGTGTIRPITIDGGAGTGTSVNVKAGGLALTASTASGGSGAVQVTAPGGWSMTSGPGTVFQSETSGSGSVDFIGTGGSTQFVIGSFGNVLIGGGSGSVNLTSSQVTVGAGPTVASGASATLAATSLANSVTISGTTAITTATGFNAIEIPRPVYHTSGAGVTVTRGASLYIENSPLADTGVTLSSPYSIWVDNGAVRFDGAFGFGGAAPVARPSVTGSRSGGVALTNLLTALAGNGIIDDNTTP